MPYLFIGKGQAFSVRPDIDLMDAFEALEGTEAYKALQERAKSTGLKLMCVTNHDEGEMSVFVGNELMPSRYTYRGKTQVLEDKQASDVSDIGTGLRMLLAKWQGWEIVESGGLIVSQFD
jgi:hypothetical protein